MARKAENAWRAPRLVLLEDRRSWMAPDLSQLLPHAKRVDWSARAANLRRIIEWLMLGKNMDDCSVPNYLIREVLALDKLPRGRQHATFREYVDAKIKELEDQNVLDELHAQFRALPKEKRKSNVVVAEYIREGVELTRFAEDTVKRGIAFSGRRPNRRKK
jgi:hypothetical protein